MVKLNDGREVFGVIYRIKNKINEKIYIGQTTQIRGFRDRYNYKGNGIERVYGYYKNNKWFNQHLINSINKYGVDNFEVIEELDTAKDIVELNYKEKRYINFYNSTDPKFGYNSELGGNNSQRNKSSKLKMYKKSSHPIYCLTTKECFYSSVEAAEEYELDNKKLQEGMKRYKKYNIKTKQNGILSFRYLFGETECKSKKPIIEINTMKLFESLTTAAKYYNLHRETISRQVNKKLKKQLYYKGTKINFISAFDYFEKHYPIYIENVKNENNIKIKEYI